MSSKKKSHGVLFTPYLQKGEDLIWVGMPEKNPFISLRVKWDVIRLWFRWAYFFLIGSMLLVSCILSAGGRFSSDTSWLLVWGQYLAIFALIAFFCSSFVRLGKTYYAITTKRLFVLRRHFWSSLDAASLMLLPEHRLQHKDEIVTIAFDPLRTDEHHRRGRILWESYDEVVYEEFHRPHLENLNQEDAQTANELLSAVKNDMLDERARQLGLMD